jgi:homocysteine S-methyltransferase
MTARYRSRLPQLEEERLFVTDGGLETDLIFNHGIDLPEFAAFVLLDDERGMEAIRSYYDGYHRIARERNAGMLLSTPTWRASRDWGMKLGYTPAQLTDVNREWMRVVEELRDEWGGDVPVVLEGMIGPRGDGYVPGDQMSEDEAADYHSHQVEAFASTAADMVTVMTINYTEEAVGVAKAADSHGMPCVISFTVETDGHLPTGQPLADAVDQVEAATGGSPAYYMINCAHPTHFAHVLEDDGGWRERIRGLRANASTMSHAELDEAEELDAGDPDDLAAGYERVRKLLPNLTVLGGCCGTDHRHVAAVAERLI